MRITDAIAEFIENTSFKDFTEKAIIEAKTCILDSLGVILAGSGHRVSKILRDYVAQVGGKGYSTILGKNSLKSSMVNSALANGTACHVLDFDDTHEVLGGHPSAVVLPAVLALGEYKKTTGKNILTAFILGIEVSCKIARGVNPQHYLSGYHVTSTVGIFGATAAVGKLLGLRNEELLYALGIAGSMSSGLKENFGTMTKSLHVGLAASNGVKAALLAQKGFTASSQILEADMGFCNVLSKGPQFERIVKNLGKPWEIEQPGIARKKYPCCARTHSAIDGVLKIVNGNNIPFENLEEIKCCTDDTAFNTLIHPNPKAALEAKFSMPFCLAVAFVEKDVFMDHFTERKINDPVILTVMKKVNHIADSEITAKGYEYRWASKVKIKLKNGVEFNETVEKPKGHPQNPLSYEETVEKFRRCANGILNRRKKDSFIAKISHLEDQKDISRLASDLASS